jgi:hypothetical protein
LTPHVVESLTALAPLVTWARAHREIIERAQAYSRRHSGWKAAPISIPALVGRDVGADEDSRAESEKVAIGYPDAS